MFALRARRRRRRVIVAGVVVTVVVAAVVVREVFLDDTVHIVTADEALDRFRDGTSTSLGTSEPEATDDVLLLPEPGVYRYTTTGSESIDALGGTSHQYPAETTITVTAAGCGVELRWDALRERYERWQLCLGDDGIVLAATGWYSYHEFFGQADGRDIDCGRSALLVPADRRARAAMEQNCTLDGVPWVPSWEVLGTESRVVAGTVMEVVHVRMAMNDDDRNWEYITQDWYLAPSGLPVALEVEKSALGANVIGDVRYDEEFTLTLTSLEPLR